MYIYEGLISVCRMILSTVFGKNVLHSCLSRMARKKFRKTTLKKP